MSDLKRGDIVQLKSGGPSMTVASRILKRTTLLEGEVDYVVCGWFRDDEYKVDEFPIDTLSPVPETA